MAIETKEHLLAALATLDTASDAELEALLQGIEEAESAIASAGSEFDPQIEAAGTATAAALTQYNGLVATAQAKQESAAAAAAAVMAVDASAQIAAIDSVTAPTVATNDPADINAAFASLASAINGQLSLIKAALAAINNPSAITGLKTASTDLAASNEAIITGAMPPAVDPQPEIDSTFAFIDGLV
jgi:hypothetical protein